MIKCKIFNETNSGPDVLQREVTEYFSDKDVMIISMNTVVEKVEGIDYLTVVILHN